MKRLLSIALMLLSFISYAQEKNESALLTVTWDIHLISKDPVYGIQNDLLNAAEKGKIKCYDSTWRELSREELKAKMTLEIEDVRFNKVECDIVSNSEAATSNDFQPKLTKEKLKSLCDKLHPDSTLHLRYRPELSKYLCILVLIEKVKLDTTVRRQLGKIESLQLFMPGDHEKLLCQFHYEDLRSLQLSQLEVIDKHEFRVYTRYGEFTIDDGQSIKRFSSLRDQRNDTVQPDKIKQSMFKYFSKNIWKYDERESVETIVYPININ